jgi:hypothetical protein
MSMMCMEHSYVLAIEQLLNVLAMEQLTMEQLKHAVFVCLSDCRACRTLTALTTCP